MKSNQLPKSLHILLADDDRDDRFFFDKALKALSVPTHLTTVKDGVKLMEYLFENSNKLPDILFLDLNMPRKNGSECLIEIKSNKALKSLPVIIYSTSLYGNVSDLLYEKGAHYYVRKTDFDELKKNLSRVFSLIVEKKPTRPSRAEFIISLEGV